MLVESHSVLFTFVGSRSGILFLTYYFLQVYPFSSPENNMPRARCHVDSIIDGKLKLLHVIYVHVNVLKRIGKY